jgi:predicted dehydrogenase
VIFLKTIGAAVIGCGAISKMHLDSIGTAGAKLLYVVDTETAKAMETADKYGCRFHADYHEILKDSNVDVVHICTPHYLHAQMAIDSMKSGKHVLTEKPMATNVSDAKIMSAVSYETGSKLGVCFQNRYNPTSAMLKDILLSGKAGRIIGAKASVTWHRDEEYYTQSDWRGSWDKEGGGVLINQAIHTLDLLQWFIGDIDSIKGSYFTSLLDKTIEVEDTANAVIKFKNGASALFYATNCYPANSPVNIELVCSNAVIRLEGDLTVTYNDGRTEHYTDDDTLTGKKSYWGSSHKRLITDFYKKLLSGEKFDIDGDEGIKALQMVKAIHRSSDTKTWTEL